MKVDPTLHARTLRLFTNDEVLIKFAMERIAFGGLKYQKDDLAERDLLVEGREELVDGLNRFVMHAEYVNGNRTLVEICLKLVELIRAIDLLR